MQGGQEYVEQMEGKFKTISVNNNFQYFYNKYRHSTNILFCKRGFCGFRTNPFNEPLKVGLCDGFYVKCRLASDNEPERRIWKISTRTKPNRGEFLYQAPFDLAGAYAADQSSPEWYTVKVPFQSFMYVRGPRIVPDGPPLNLTGGLYQIGMTMSKFAFGANTTELLNFRDGFFDFQMREIGLYKENNPMEMDSISKPQVLNKDKKPIIVKILLPISKIFFSESR